jgi:thiamine monophosphate synthase
MYQTIAFGVAGIAVVSAIFSQPIVAAGAFIASGLFAVADAISRKA